MDITRQIADYAASVMAPDIPSPVTARAKRLLLDYLGNVVRGASLPDSSPVFLSALDALGLDLPGHIRIAGSGRGHQPAAAALLAGIYGHSLDFDDTHGRSSLHPSAPVISAALAAAQMAHADGRTTLAAIVAGYEVCCRLGLALDPTAHYRRGYHPTATAGAFGAAIAAGCLFGLSAAQHCDASGALLSLAAGSLQFLENGSWNKRFQVGMAAMNGLLAARLAHDGFRGAAAAIEGRRGLLSMYTDVSHPDLAVAELGAVFETLAIGVKPYPSCRYTHAALDLLIDLRRDHGLAHDDILRVSVGMHRNGVALTGEPAAAKRQPRSVVDGQFSMPFVGAVALWQGRFGWDDYALLADPGVLGLAERFFVSADPTLEGDADRLFAGSVKVETRAGTFERSKVRPSGEPDNFPDDEALIKKFRTLAGPVLAADADEVAGRILRFDEVADVGGLLASMQPRISN